MLIAKNVTKIAGKYIFEPTAAPIPAAIQSPAAVVSPSTFESLRTIRPAPKNPIPKTIWPIILAGSKAIPGLPKNIVISERNNRKKS